MKSLPAFFWFSVVFAPRKAKNRRKAVCVSGLAGMRDFGRILPSETDLFFGWRQGIDKKGSAHIMLT